MVNQNWHKIEHFVQKAKWFQVLEDSILFSFLGRRRSGKSTLCLALLKKIDPDMDEDQIVFTNEEFRQATREYQRRAIMWDEPSVTAYSREYQDEANRLLNKTLQVFGFRRLVIGLAYQHAHFLDKHTRWLVDVYFICRSEIMYPKDKKSTVMRQNFVEPRVLLTDWVNEPVLAPYKIRVGDRYLEMGELAVPQLDELFEWAGINKKFWHAYLRKKREFFESAEWEKEAEEQKGPKIHPKTLERLLREEEAFIKLLRSLTDGVEVERYGKKVGTVKLTLRQLARLTGTNVGVLENWLTVPVYQNFFVKVKSIQ